MLELEIFSTSVDIPYKHSANKVKIGDSVLKLESKLDVLSQLSEVLCSA